MRSSSPVLLGIAATRSSALRLVTRRVRSTPAALSRSFGGGYAENVSDLIGNTPLVKLNRVVPEGMVASKILLKLEMQNPGGSIKDRIALSMIKQAEDRGEITPGKTTIVEATSGNTGIGLAMVAAARGYECLIVMPQVPPMYFDRLHGEQASDSEELTTPSMVRRKHPAPPRAPLPPKPQPKRLHDLCLIVVYR